MVARREAGVATWSSRPRRSPQARPGELIHIDIKKLDRRAPAIATPGRAGTSSISPWTTPQGWPTPKCCPPSAAHGAAGFLVRAVRWYRRDQGVSMGGS